MPNNQESYLRLDDVRVDDVSIVLGPDNKISIMDHYALIEISENIFQNNISGVIAQIDAVNLPTNIPITGQEMLELTFHTPSVGEPITLQFLIDKITDAAPLQNKQTQMYDIHFVCPTYLSNLFININTCFDGSISQAVENIFKSHWNPGNNVSSTKDMARRQLLTVEPSYGRSKIIIPNWTPLFAINWLSKRAISNDFNKSANYVFYQDLDGFHFSSVDALFMKAPARMYIFGVTDAEEVVRGGMDKEIDVDSTLSNIKKLKICGWNRSEETKKGAYASSLLMHNIISKRYENFAYSPIQDTDERPTLNAHPSYLSRGVYNVANKGKSYFVPTHTWLHETGEESDSVVPKTGNDNVQIWLQRHDAQKAQLLSNSIEFDVSGDSTRRVGDVVSVLIQSMEGVDETGQMKVDGYLSGNYLVTEIRHRIAKGNQGHKMRMKLCKDSDIEPYSPLVDAGTSVDSEIGFA